MHFVKFDRDNKGFLTESEQGDAKEALAGGLGKDHYSDYFSYKPTTRFQKTLEQTLATAPAWPWRTELARSFRGLRASELVFPEQF